MAAHTQNEVQAALNYLLTGNGGKPLTSDQMAWELNQANNSFGECLYLAAHNPVIFPSVTTAPFMRRAIIGRQNSIDGHLYPVTQLDSTEPPVDFSFPAYLFRNAVLV
jgi:hypothetical protein